MKKRVFTKSDAIKKGMKLEQEIMDDKGHVLIARGTVLDDFMVNSLLQMQVEGVFTEGNEVSLSSFPMPENAAKEPPKEIAPEIEERIAKISETDRAKILLSESVKERVSEGVSYLYANTDTENFSDTTTNVAHSLMKAVLENDAVAVDIEALKVSDEYTFKHSVDVASMAMIVGRKYGLDQKETYEVGITGLLHDIGKSKIPLEILNKPGKLDDWEFRLMKKHSLLGYQLLKKKKDFSPRIMLGVLEHHEKIDGTGYPNGILGKDISLYAKILAVVDIYDALVTERVYKKAFSHRDALEMIMAMTGELDIGIMQSFLSSVILYPVGSNVLLSNGEWARVVKNQPDCITRPKVVGLETGRTYDLAEDIKCANIVVMQ